MNTTEKSQPKETEATETLSNIKLLFMKSKDGEANISKYSDKIVLADRALAKAIEPNAWYNCTLRLMYKGNGYIAVQANRIEGIKTILTFRKGKKYGGGLVSSFDFKTVIVPDNITNIDTGMQYKCEISIAPKGNAYLLNKAETIPTGKAKVVTCPAPLYMVQVEINNVTDPDLTFDCMGGDSRILSTKVWQLKNRNIFDKQEIISQYEMQCNNLMAEFQEKIYDNNMNKYKR